MIVQGAGVVVTFAGVVAGLAVQVQDGAFVHFGSTTSPASVDLTGVGASAEVDGANSAVQFSAPNTSRFAGYPGAAVGGAVTFAAASATVAAFGAGDRLNFLSPAVSFSYSAMPNPGSVLQYGTLTVTEQSGFVVTVSLQDLYQHLPTDFAISNGGIVLRTKQPPVISGTSAGLQVTPAQMPADMACRPISSSWPRSMPGCLAVRLTRRG